MPPDTTADLWRLVALDCFQRRRRYPPGSIERTLCVESARWHLRGYRAAIRAAARKPPGAQEPGPPDSQSEADRRRGLLVLLHPGTSPMITEDLGKLIDPPGKHSPTASYLRFQRMIAGLMAEEPDRLSYPRYDAAVRIILDWRADIPPHDRFWRPDPAAPIDLPAGV